MQKLSRTILDAIKVTKSLGFKYLWVDAICIVQDSAADKIRELAVMHRIYQDSSLTIVAASAASADEGFLGVREVPKRNTFRIPMRLSQDQFTVISIQEHEQYDDLTEPTNRRAWTLQEQLLSARLLLYASHTLQWQCRKVTCNLGDSYHAPSLSSIPRLPLIKPVSEAAPTAGDMGRERAVDDALHPILQHWMRVIISYSNRNATLQSDKLTALAGLAVYFSPILGPGYYAGIWETCFLQQLCWQSPSNTTFLSRPRDYRAPSWSWASVDGTLYFRSYLPNSYQPYRCEFVESRTTLKSPSLPFGEVTDGYLKLRGVTREAWFNSSRSEEITWQGVASNRDRTGDDLPVGGGFWDRARGFSDTEQDNVDRPIVCLPLYIAENIKDGRVGGLMLTTSQNGLFRRIGRFFAHASDFDGFSEQDVTIV